MNNLVSTLPSDQTPQTKMRAYTLFILFALVLIAPNNANAQATTIGTSICNMYNQIQGNGQTSVAQLFAGIAYILGFFLIGTGFMKIKETGDSPDRTPLIHGVLRCVGGSCLVGLPAMTGWIITTIYLQPGPGGLGVCQAAAPQAITATNWVPNFVNNIKVPMQFIISGLGYTIGTLYMIRGFSKLARHSTDPRAYSMPSIVANLIVGALIFTIGSSESAIMNTLFGTTTATASSVVANWKMMTSMNASANFITAVQSGLQFFQIIGAIAFLRGWMIVKSAAEGGQNSMAVGFTHILGGIFALNIYAVLQMFDAALGTGLLT